MHHCQAARSGAPSWKLCLLDKHGVLLSLKVVVVMMVIVVVMMIMMMMTMVIMMMMMI